MKRLATLAFVACAALSTSACITVFDADGDDSWRGNNAQPFDASRDACHAGTDSQATFNACMAEKGWTRD